MSFDIRTAREELAKAKERYYDESKVIPSYFQTKFDEICTYFASQPHLNNYGRILRLRDWNYGLLAQNIKYNDLSELKIKDIILHNNSLHIKFADEGSWSIHNYYYIHLKYDDLDKFSKEFIETKFEYERKLQIAENKVKDLTNAKAELEKLEKTIKSSTERYEYLKNLIETKEKKKETGI